MEKIQSHRKIKINISVVIPTYNRLNQTKRAIKSVLNQSYKPKEIIVINDGSTDETSKLKDELSIKYFYKPNGGVSSARNFGIKKASFEWIAFLDSDDEWESEKLASHVSFHKKNLNIDISYTNEKWIRNFKEVKMPKKYAKHSGYIFQNCLSHCIIAPSSVLMKKDLFDKIGFFDESLEVCEDYDLWLKIASKYEIGLIDKPLTIKHAGHNDQLSFKHWGMDRFRVKSLQKIYFTLDDISQKEALDKVLKQKLEILIIGAKKHKKMEMLKEFTFQLNQLKN